MAKTSFTSPSMSLSIVVTPSRYRYANNGDRYFAEGKHAKFVNGKFDTEDEEIVAFLMKHPDYGVLFNCVNPGVTVSKEEVREKKEAKHDEERELAKKTDAKETNKTKPAVGNSPASGEGVSKEPLPGTPAD